MPLTELKLRPGLPVTSQSEIPISVSGLKQLLPSSVFQTSITFTNPRKTAQLRNVVAAYTCALKADHGF